MSQIQIAKTDSLKKPCRKFPFSALLWLSLGGLSTFYLSQRINLQKEQQSVKAFSQHVQISDYKNTTNAAFEISSALQLEHLSHPEQTTQQNLNAAAADHLIQPAFYFFRQKASNPDASDITPISSFHTPFRITETKTSTTFETTLQDRTCATFAKYRNSSFYPNIETPMTCSPKDKDAVLSITLPKMATR